MTKMMNSKMNKTMTAACAGAAFCCACAASISLSAMPYFSLMRNALEMPGTPTRSL